ncbi:hypothetical protein M0R45_000092 [Rubus argutus]|uniref:Small ribosomal subunit protein uS7 domain-containing protein n=1 Tax=Rubus argutus TaxID=59490 RepID=A0AAW1VMH4_RUBAR
MPKTSLSLCFSPGPFRWNGLFSVVPSWVVRAFQEPHNDVKLFNKWSFDDVQVSDISLGDYIGVSQAKHATYVPHTAGRIVRHAMEIIHLLTDLNPIQVIVDAVVNSGPREDATRYLSPYNWSSNSYAIKKKDEIERVAKANR